MVQSSPTEIERNVFWHYFLYSDNIYIASIYPEIIQIISLAESFILHRRVSNHQIGQGRAKITHSVTPCLEGKT